MMQQTQKAESNLALFRSICSLMSTKIANGIMGIGDSSTRSLAKKFIQVH